MARAIYVDVETGTYGDYDALYVLHPVWLERDEFTEGTDEDRARIAREYGAKVR